MPKSSKNKKQKNPRKTIRERTEFTIKENGNSFTASYHGKGSHKPGKTEWCIKNEEAFQCFKNACLHNVCHHKRSSIGENNEEDYVWLNDNLNGMCSVLYQDQENNGGENKTLRVVGENGEYFGYFPSIRNEGERWHGYPVFGKEIQKGLLYYWKINNVISNLDYIRIKRCKI